MSCILGGFFTFWATRAQVAVQNYRYRPLALQWKFKGLSDFGHGPKESIPWGGEHHRDSLGGEGKVSSLPVFTAPKPRPYTTAQGKQVDLVFSYIGIHFSLVAQLVKNPPAMPETWVRSLGWEDPLEKGRATHSSISAWRIPWTIHGVSESDMTEWPSLYKQYRTSLMRRLRKKSHNQSPCLNILWRQGGSLPPPV